MSSTAYQKGYHPIEYQGNSLYPGLLKNFSVFYRILEKNQVENTPFYILIKDEDLLFHRAVQNLAGQLVNQMISDSSKAVTSGEKAWLQGSYLPLLTDPDIVKHLLKEISVSFQILPSDFISLMEPIRILFACEEDRAGALKIYKNYKRKRFAHKEEEPGVDIELQKTLNALNDVFQIPSVDHTLNRGTFSVNFDPVIATCKKKEIVLFEGMTETGWDILTNHPLPMAPELQMFKNDLHTFYAVRQRALILRKKVEGINGFLSSAEKEWLEKGYYTITKHPEIVREILFLRSIVSRERKEPLEKGPISPIKGLEDILNLAHLFVRNVFWMQTARNITGKIPTFPKTPTIRFDTTEKPVL